MTCSLPGKLIISNVTLLRNILDYIEWNNSAILPSLDQEKTFRRVNLTFLMHLLNRYGFGRNFCCWVSTFYSGAFMRIILNGNLTREIPLCRGVRQDDPLSPLLGIALSAF